MNTADTASERPDDIAVLGNIGVIGSGALGRALARALAAGGGNVIAVAARRLESAQELAARIPGCRAYATPEEVAEVSSIVMLAVPDDAITPLAESIGWSAGQRIVHLSGAVGTRALAAAAARGAVVAALHPLMTFTRAQAESSIGEIQARLHGCVWALETSDDALRHALQGVVRVLGGRTTVLTENDRVPYHISGVLASNYVVTLLGAAVALWKSFGEDATLAREALIPLLRASVENLAIMEPSAALSGPIARGDIGTLRSHLEWLSSAARDSNAMAALLDAYLALAHLTIPLAEAKGTLSPEHAASIGALLDSYRRAE